MRTGSVKRRRRGGFTLVELIVVLVILAILAAIMIPALSGWIQKAKEKRYVMEARSCVMASDAVALELYGSGKLSVTSFLSNHQEEILKLAGLNNGASVTGITFSGSNQSEPPVAKLTYKSADGTTVLYDRNGNPVYTVGGSSAAPGAPTHQVSWQQTIQAVYQNNPTQFNTTTLTNAVRDENGQLPSLIAIEQNMLKGTDTVKGVGSPASYVWKPVQAKYYNTLGEGIGYLMIAQPAGDATSGTQNMNATMIYYNGSYYVCVENHPYQGLKIGSTAITNNFAAGTLANDPSWSTYDFSSLPTSGKVWLKYDL